MNPDKSTFLDSNTGLVEQNDLIRFFNNQSQLHQTKNKVIHFKISAHPSDAVDKEGSCKIAREVMSKLNFIDCPYVAVLHTNTEVEHIHLVVSRINFDGKLIHQSLDHFSVLKPLAREIEVKYGLKKVSSRNRSADSFLTLKEKQSALKGFDLKKGELRKNIREALYQTYDLDEFISSCAKSKTEVKVRRNEYNKPIGISYCYEGQACTGTRLGNGYKISEILKKLESNSSTRYDSVELDVEAVKKVLIDSYSKSSNWLELKMNLMKHNVEIEPARDNSKKFSVTLNQETVEFEFPGSHHQILMQWFNEFMKRKRGEDNYQEGGENVNGVDSFRSSNQQSNVFQKFNSSHEESPHKKSRGM